ncbi:hypothetical protein PMAYCL1PPCAC_07340, partial [Pristionchus mayeri]
GSITVEGRTLQKGCAYCVYTAPLPADIMGTSTVAPENKASVDKDDTILKLMSLLTGREVNMEEVGKITNALKEVTMTANQSKEEDKMKEMQATIERLSNKLNDVDRSSKLKIQE